MKSSTRSLTEGPLAKQILLVSLPLALSNLLQVLFNMSDVAVVGRFAGSTALGAVGSTSIFVTLFTGFLIGLGNGINVLVARFYGARHPDDVHDTVHSALIVSLIAGVALLAICVFMMLGMELMNSAVERAVDKPDTTHWWSAGAAKDMAAGGVLVTAFGAVVVGICLFGNAAALNAIWTSVTATPLSTALWVLSLVLAYLFTFRLGKQEQVKTPKENKTEEK